MSYARMVEELYGHPCFVEVHKAEIQTAWFVAENRACPTMPRFPAQPDRGFFDMVPKAIKRYMSTVVNLELLADAAMHVAEHSSMARDIKKLIDLGFNVIGQGDTIITLNTLSAEKFKVKFDETMLYKEAKALAERRGEDLPLSAYKITALRSVGGHPETFYTVSDSYPRNDELYSMLENAHELARGAALIDRFVRYNSLHERVAKVHGHASSNRVLNRILDRDKPYHAWYHACMFPKSLRLMACDEQPVSIPDHMQAVYKALGATLVEQFVMLDELLARVLSTLLAVGNVPHSFYGGANVRIDKI